MGAMALFGEKYGDRVRVVSFGDSVELCGGTHVKSTGTIGYFKIVSEGAIAAGIRRIEAVTAKKAEEYINEKLSAFDEIASRLKATGSITEAVGKLLAENADLRKTIEKLEARSASDALKTMVEKARIINNIKLVSGRLATGSADVMKNMAYQVRSASEDTILVIGADIEGKASLLVMVSDRLVKEKNIDASAIIKQIAREINGGGGGQPFLATAGGKNPDGIERAIEKAAELIKQY
jgi:alanyl-tRNA synthetase